MENYTILSRFADYIKTASFNKKKNLFLDLNLHLENNGIESIEIAQIMESISRGVSCYIEPHCYRLLHSLVITLVKVDRVGCIGSLVEAFEDKINFFTNVKVITKQTCSEAFILLKISCTILDGFHGDNNHLIPFMQHQSVLMHVCQSGNHDVIRELANKTFNNFLCKNQHLVTYYVKSLSSSSSFNAFCMVGFLIKFFERNPSSQHTSYILELKKEYIQKYIEEVIKSRTQINRVTLSSSSSFVMHLNDDDLKQHVMVNLNKSLLRSPEISLVCLKDLLRVLDVDVSSHVAGFNKHLVSQSLSKDEKMRSIAQETCLYLSRKCTPDVLLSFIDLLFSTLTGPEGKAAISEQKVSMLQSVHNCSDVFKVPGNSYLPSTKQLTSTVLHKLVSFVLSEGHEGTCQQALSVASAWVHKSGMVMQEAVVDDLIKVISTKTSSVKTTALLAVHATINPETKNLLTKVLPTLNKTIGSTTSHPTDSLVACLIITNACYHQLSSAEEHEVMWKVILDNNKQHFCNHKFLASIPTEVCTALTDLICLLFTSFPQHLQQPHFHMYAQTLIHCITHADSDAKKQAINKINKLSSSSSSSSPPLPVIIAQCISDDLNSHHSKTDTQKDDRIYFYLYESLLDGVLKGGNDDIIPEVVKVAHVGLHHPRILRHHPKPWVRVSTRVCKHLLNKYNTHLLSAYTAITLLSESQKAALTSLAEIAPQDTFPLVKTQVESIYSNQSYLSISHNDHALLTWPEGELFDKSILEAFSSQNMNSNIKRENKLYSYEDQLAEIELKKELAKKGKMKEEMKLTKKQQETIQKQLSKEAATRSSIILLKNQLSYANSLVESCIAGNANYSLQAFTWLLPLLLPLCQSVMAADDATNLLKKMALLAFEGQKYFALSLANCIIRHLKPQCKVDSDWTQESLVHQSERLINQLFINTGCSLDRHQTFEQPITAASFHYAFLLIQSVLKKSFLSDDWQLKCLVMISCHAKLRSENKSDLNSSHHLPVNQLFDICLQLSAMSSKPQLQEQSKLSLLQLAAAVSGEAGCVEIDDKTFHLLLEHLLSPYSFIRSCVLECLEVMLSLVDRRMNDGLASLLWLNKHDTDDRVAKLACSILRDHPLPSTPDFFNNLLSYVVHHEPSVRRAASVAITAAVQQHKAMMSLVLTQLLTSYEEKLYIPPIPRDEMGRVLQDFKEQADNFSARCGVALVLKEMGEMLEVEEMKKMMSFVVREGLLDRHPEVQQHMLQAAIHTTNLRGKENIDFLFELFENFLTTAPSTGNYDFARQGMAILMGTLAKHLGAGDAKLKPIVVRLITSLSTPSEQVQSAVANCLHPLVAHMKEDAPQMAKEMIEVLFGEHDYGQRRGAAYGLAGLVKGMGILSLKQLNIIDQLTTAFHDKKNNKKREGALLAFEMFCRMLERLFEPYVVHLLPHLLTSFGDPSQNIREAADDTAKVVMSKLSGHGVKLILPLLLNALEEDSWRTKCGSIELLGAMAHCAPKQLSACLPNIVPKITEVLSDSHSKVQKSGCQALSQIGSVIKNPEIQAVVPVLLKGIQDPVSGTDKALEKLLETKFVHFIDAPSLALIMPVVHRALVDRVSDTRKMAAQIIANMYSLTDHKDLSPYLPTMVPGLKESLLNPMPDVRSASARAFGTMVKSMGEQGVGDLLPWLFDTLTSESSTVDRAGAAQGLAEVVGGLGLSKLNELMPDVIETTSRTDINPCVRDGYIMLYIYLPSAFGDNFLPFVGPIIPTILQALADETEYVRETALKAGQKIVHQYADTAIELLLPEVENGLFDDNWRIRYSSIHLMGDLLFRISGVTGKMSTQGKDEDDNFGTEASQKAILRALGQERFNKVFSGLYVCRHDSSPTVRQAALHVWKMLVTHTPRTLRDIMATLFSLLLLHLSSPSYDKRHVAAMTLGDIVKKLGEKVLPEIMPIMEGGLSSQDADERRGVCYGLCEIINSTSHDHVVAFSGSLLPTIRKGLMDHNPSVRQAASEAFNTLHDSLGAKCIDDILPSLLSLLKNPETSENALDGLRQMIHVKGRVMLPHLIPHLTADPVNSKALSFLSSAAGEALKKHLNKVMHALIKVVSAAVNDKDLLAEELENCRQVVLSMRDEDSVQNLLEILLEASSSSTLEPNPLPQRQAALLILGIFCAETREDYSDHVVRLIRAMIMMAGEEDEKVLHASHDCLHAIIKKVEAVNVVQYMSQIRQAMRLVTMHMPPEQPLPGFSLPKKGIAPLVLVFREAILTGSPEIKESATVGLTDAIRRSSPEALKHSVINITGALIRILGERFGYSVKVAMLDSAALLLTKCGANLKAFIPQLQTTFLKTLNDSNKVVRLRSATALSCLVDIHNRLDPLFNELNSLLKNSDDLVVKASVVQAIRLCLTRDKCKLQDKTQQELVQSIRNHCKLPAAPSSEQECLSMVSSACLGVLCGRLNEDLLDSIVTQDMIDGTTNDDWTTKYMHSTTLSVALKQHASLLSKHLSALLSSCVNYASNDRAAVKMRGLRCVIFLMKHQLPQVHQNLIDTLTKLAKSESSDIKQSCCSGISLLAKHHHTQLLENQSFFLTLINLLLQLSKDRQQVVRSSADHSLVALLDLKAGDTVMQICLDNLKQADKENLIDTSNKSLKRLKLLAEPIEEDFDNTLL